MEFNFTIKNDKLTSVAYPKGVTGNVNTYICRFDIDCDISGLIWFCIFKQGDNVYNRIIEDNTCIMPYEVLTSVDPVYIGCYGTNSDDDIKRVSTNFAFFDVKLGAYSEGIIPDVPTPDAWDVYVNSKVNPLLDEIETAENARTTAEEERVSAENNRIIAENDRLIAEEHRQNAESDRATAENQRLSAETVRNSNEIDRISAEAARVEAESARAEELAKKADANTVYTKIEVDDKIREVTQKIKESYPYKVVNMADCFRLIPTKLNTVTYAYGGLTQSGTIAFEFSPLVSIAKDESYEAVVILDLSSLTTTPTIQFEAGIKWLNGEPPTIEAGKIYMFSFILTKDENNSSLFYLGIGGEFA